MDEPVYVVDVSPDEMVIDGDAAVAEMLHPGISEWALTRTDGSGQVLPVASVIRIGEGELERADSAAIQQQLLPLQITFHEEFSLGAMRIRLQAAQRSRCCCWHFSA